MILDRVKSGLGDFVQAQFPDLLYRASYGGRVVLQRGANSFDFEPDDQRVPSMSGIPIKLPCPGFSLTLDPSQSPRATLMFDNADPSKPELHLWEAPGLAAAVVTAEEKLSFAAPSVNLGADPAADQVIKGTSRTAAETPFLESLFAALTAAAAAFSNLAIATPAAAGTCTPAGVACGSAASAAQTFSAALPSTLSEVTRTV